MSSGGPFRKFSLSDVSTQNSVKSSVQRGIRGARIEARRSEFFQLPFRFRSIDPAAFVVLTLSTRPSSSQLSPPPLKPNSESLRALPFARGERSDRRHHAEEGAGEHREVVSGEERRRRRKKEEAFFFFVLSFSLPCRSDARSSSLPDPLIIIIIIIISDTPRIITPDLPKPQPARTTSRSSSSTRPRSSSASVTAPGCRRCACCTSTRT